MDFSLSEHWLPLVWYLIIAFGIFMYVLMDGFVLGLGMLTFWARDEQQRDIMVQTAAPIWDGNETWLVLGGAGLFAAFPLAYAVVLSALYLPLLVMLIALIFRGVAFEFRFKADRSRYVWSRAFFWGSLLATFSQGVVLGAFVQGFEVVERQYAGGIMDWLTPFSLMTGVALVCGYALLGCGWLIIKTEGDIQAGAFRLARPLALIVVAFMLITSLWMPFVDPAIKDRWFTPTHLLLLAPVPLLVLVNAFYLLRSVQQRRELAPFLFSISFFALGFLGLAIGIWPNIIPPDVSFVAGSAYRGSQIFTLVGTIIMLPVILSYTAWSYHTFRGKIRSSTHYYH